MDEKLKEKKEAFEKELKLFIEKNRKICWESAYENEEYCIGEKSVRKFVHDLYYNFF